MAEAMLGEEAQYLNVLFSYYFLIAIEQFTGLLDFCDHAANLGIMVVVAALSGDFERKVVFELS